MASAKKKAPKSAATARRPGLATPAEIGELCADVYRHAVKLARAQDADERTVEELALGEVRAFLAACIRQSKADWKAYAKTARARGAPAGTAAGRGGRA